MESWIPRLADCGTWSANVQCNRPIAGSVITEEEGGDARQLRNGSSSTYGIVDGSKALEAECSRNGSLPPDTRLTWPRRGLKRRWIRSVLYRSSTMRSIVLWRDFATPNWITRPRPDFFPLIFSRRAGWWDSASEDWRSWRMRVSVLRSDRSRLPWKFSKNIREPTVFDLKFSCPSVFKIRKLSRVTLLSCYEVRCYNECRSVRR